MLVGASVFDDAKAFEISKADTMLLIASRVFKNECKVEKDCLLEWSVGEGFLSLGFRAFYMVSGKITEVYSTEGFQGVSSIRSSSRGASSGVVG